MKDKTQTEIIPKIRQIFRYTGKYTLQSKRVDTLNFCSQYMQIRKIRDILNGELWNCLTDGRATYSQITS